MKKPSVTFVELPATVDGTLNGNLSRDIYSLVRLPSRAIDLLAAISREEGFDDVVVINPSYNKVHGKFTMGEWQRLIVSDIVAISSITRTAKQTYELADAIKKINPAVKIIFGGPHVSALPYEAIEHADIIVKNEGDHTIKEILNAYVWDMDFSKIKGIVFKNKIGEIVDTGKRQFLTSEELSALPFPIYPQNVIKGITHTVIITSRGCPYDCEYCAVIENFGRKFRFLDTDRTIKLIEHTLAQSRKPIFFGDDNFAANPNRSKKLLETILSRGIKMPPWLTQVRVESAKDTELLKLMRRAGCERVCIGFESANPETLKHWNKRADVESNTFAISEYHKAGISIHGMFIIGADTDTKESIKQTAEYAKNNRIDTVQFTLMVPLPGTKMTEKLEKTQRVITHDWHLYDGHHVVIQPECMPASDLTKAADDAWADFYSISEAFKHLFYGTEHWFNFIVRILGNKSLQKLISDTSYYRRALTKLDGWRLNTMNEYDQWLAKCNIIAKDAKKSFEEKQKLAKSELEKALKKISEKKDQLDDYFAPYKQKIVNELENLMKSKLSELALA